MQPGERPADVGVDEVVAALFNATFATTRQLFHHHAEALLDQQPDIRNLVLDSVAASGQLAAVHRRRDGGITGITSTDANRLIKAHFVGSGRWRFEVRVEDGVFHDAATTATRIEGFDFARYDVESNVAALWSLCFGRRRLDDGERYWVEYRRRNPDLTTIIDRTAAMGVTGVDLVRPRREPTIVGEIQMGNWALAYRDMLKLLAARAQLPIDLLVYVVPDGTLSDAISTGTVNYTSSSQILREFADVITVPTWLLGIDVALDHA